MSSIWAITKNTIKQVLRMRIALVFIILLVILLPVMGFATEGDATVKGKLQTFVTYSLGLTSLLLCILTIAVSIYSLTSELTGRQIFTVLTKPVRRWQLLLGKFFGILLLDIALLVIFASVIYTIAVYMPQFTDASDEQHFAAQNEFFTAREELEMPILDVSEGVDKKYRQLKEADQLDDIYAGMSEQKVKKQLTKQLELRARSATVGEELIWQFYDVKPFDANESLFIKFKFQAAVSPPDLQIISQWRIGDDRGYPFRGLIFNRKDSIGISHEIEIPAAVVADDNYFAVRFVNLPVNDTAVIFPFEEGLQILYKADSFTANFIKTTLLILLRLIFLTCLGILTATFLSFPVAILFCLVFFFTGTISGFIIESFDSLSEGLSAFYHFTVRPIILFLPRFDKFSPGNYLVPARLLSWVALARIAAVMVAVKSLLLFLLALLIFKFKEIAKIVI